MFGPKNRKIPGEYYFSYSILLLVIAINSLLCLIYKVRLITGVYTLEKTSHIWDLVRSVLLILSYVNYTLIKKKAIKICKIALKQMKRHLISLIMREHKTELQWTPLSLT